MLGQLKLNTTCHILLLFIDNQKMISQELIDLLLQGNTDFNFSGNIGAPCYGECGPTCQNLCKLFK